MFCFGECRVTKYDSVIIGGGHNGLVAAAYLARSGRKVLVLERRELLGGCAVTEEIWPGYRVSTSAYLTILLQERIVQELELARYGYQVDAKDPAVFSAFPDGRHFCMWQDRAKTLAEIAKFSRHDADVYPAYEEQLERLSQVVEGLLLTTPPAFPLRASDLVDYLRLAGKMRKLGPRDLVALVKIFTQSAAEFLDEWFQSEEVKVTLATDGVIGANGGPRSPGTAYILLHHCMGGAGGHRGIGARQGRGDPRKCAGRQSARARRPGARRGARKRRGDRGRHGGVESRSQAHLPAPADPKDLDAEFVRAIRNFRIEGTSCKINLALNGLPEFTAYPGGAPSGPGPHHKATMHICPSIDYVERAWDDAKYGRASQRPLLELTIPTMYDASLAPPGKHIMGIFLQYAPYTLREGTWDELREPFGDRVISLIEEYAPNIRQIVEHRQVLSPLDLERRFGITGGNIFHGEMSLDQMF